MGYICILMFGIFLALKINEMGTQLEKGRFQLMENKVIVTAALTGGVHAPSMSPYLPITPQQLTDEAVRSYEAGASIVHLHVRNPENGMPSTDVELFREVGTNIKARCNVVQCFSTGEGLTTAERAKVVTELKPETASLNFGSLNLALHDFARKIKDFQFDWEKSYLEETEDYVFTNTFKTMRELTQIFKETGTKPEIELYDIGMVNNLAYMIYKGYVQTKVNLQFVMGGLGAIPATPRNLIYLYETAKDQITDFNWSICSAGKTQFPLCTIAATMGGNVRVGLEDNLYIKKGVLAKSNAEQVEKIIKILRELDLEPATPEEAREILGLKGSDKVNF